MSDDLVSHRVLDDPADLPEGRGKTAAAGHRGAGWLRPMRAPATVEGLADVELS
jgi:hypothetical protein